MADGFPSEPAFPTGAVPTKTSGLAIASLVLGIVSLGCGCLTGIPGIICGILGLREIGKSEREREVPRVTGQGLAIGGIVTSAIFMMISIIAVLVALALGIPLGIAAALNRGRFMDWFCMVFATVGISAPVFVMQASSVSPWLSALHCAVR